MRWWWSVPVIGALVWFLLSLAIEGEVVLAVSGAAVWLLIGLPLARTRHRRWMDDPQASR